MLEIINEQGLVLELGEHSIPVERHNPLFNDPEKFFQDITYPGTAPLSPANRSFIKNGHLVEADNSVYEFPVQVRYRGTPYFKGLFNYRIAEGGIDYTLRLNFGALADRVKNTRLPEIRIGRSVLFISSPAAFAEHMTDTLQHPENYPYCFFPIKNTNKVPDGTEEAPVSETYEFMNHWRYAEQSVGTSGALGLYSTCEAPLWKLKHILQVVAEYLGLTAAGDLYGAEHYDDIYIYTRRCIDFLDNPRIMPPMWYMPNITVAEFLKEIRERMHFSIDFDLYAGQMVVNVPDLIYCGTDIVDISEYVEQVKEHEPITREGYLVTLKPDQQDDVFKQADDSYQPVYALRVGKGADTLEMKCGTLKSSGDGTNRFAETRQELLWTNEDHFPLKDASDPSTRNEWPLRLVRYLGFNETSPGKYYPESEGYDVNLTDADWYRFLNDGKRVVIQACMPYHILLNLSPTAKILFRTNEGNYAVALIEKIAYDLGGTVEEIRCRIDAYSLRQNQTEYKIEQITQPLGDEDRIISVKAYFDPVSHGFTELTDLEFVSADYGTLPVDPIKFPTDEFGAGGQPGWIRIANPIDIQVNVVGYLRTKTRPRYADILGDRQIFIQDQFSENGLYWHTGVFGISVKVAKDMGIWIVY